ncbi:hypothetical protein Tco_0453402 [Tanacetum coccineum]
MAPTMTTRNASRRTASTRGRRTAGQAGRGGGRVGEQAGRIGGRTDNQGGRGNRANRGVDEVAGFSTVITEQLQGLLPTIIAQVGDHICNQGINGSRNDNATDDNIQEDDRNANIGNGRNGCSYKEFVGNKVKYSAGSLIGRALTWWNFEVRTRGVKPQLEAEFWSHSMVGASHAAVHDDFHELAIHGMVVATKPLMIQNAILKAVVLTDETVRNRSLKRTGVDPTSIDQIP